LTTRAVNPPAKLQRCGTGHLESEASGHREHASGHAVELSPDSPLKVDIFSQKGDNRAERLTLSLSSSSDELYNKLYFLFLKTL
jgi:hypothetical protein